MIDTTQTPAPAPAGRVTLDDVRAALADSDPNQTNASKLRATLGRGSFGTIQQHLNTLRAELATAAAPLVSADAVPALPMDAAQQMWAAAWSAAQVQTLRRTEHLSAERDAALLRLETMTADVAGLTATVDDQAEQLDQAAQAAIAAAAAHAAGLDTAAAVAVELERTRTELTQAVAAAAHAAEIAGAGREMLRQELARLTDQVGELKAHLYARVADAAPASGPAKTKG